MSRIVCEKKALSTPVVYQHHHLLTPGGLVSTKVVIGMCRKHGSQNQAARYINGSLFFSKMRYMDGCACFNRYIDGPFFIIGTQKENNALCHMYINKIIFLLLNQLMFVKFP